jgi:hypothetical protein
VEARRLVPALAALSVHFGQTYPYAGSRDQPGAMRRQVKALHVQIRHPINILY